MHSGETYTAARHPSAAARAAYARRQAALLRALISDGPLPPGFDAERAELLAHALLRKRSRAVARVWPAVAHSLGSSYDGTFRAFACSSPLRTAHAVADGLAFVSWLGARQLDDAACREFLGARVRYSVARRCVRTRRLPSLAFVRTRLGALIVAVRLPLVGTRLFCMPGPAPRSARVDENTRGTCRRKGK